MMGKTDKIISKLEEQGLMPLFYHDELEICVSILKALYAAGVRIVEYTNRGDAALENFKALKEIAVAEMPELFLGIGTIKNKKAAKSFIHAGADFLVSPALAEDVYETADKNNVLWIPGCMTPTEILKAEDLGLSLVKLFPGNVLGPGYVKAIRSLFPAMHFMPTGGVETNEANISEWFASGVCAVGMGSNLISAEVIKQKNYDGITTNAATVLAIINKIKSSAKN